jgi:hypothetical protein
MRSLLRKDAIWLVPLTVAGMLIGLMAMSSLDGAGLWFHPRNDFGPGSLLFFWIAAGILGLCAGLFEDATFTREYLLHRPVSPARLFWTRQLGCGLALVCWIALTPALHLAGSLLFAQDAPAVEPGRYWQMLSQGSVGLPFYAVALFAAVLVRRGLLAIIVAATLSTALLMLFAAALYTERSTALVHQLLAPISVLIALPLLRAALGLQREGRDLDRPLSRARLGAVLGALVVFSVAGSAALHVLQLEGRRNIIDGYPRIARMPDGATVLLGSKYFGKPYGQPWRVDEHHQRIAGPVEKAELAYEPRDDQSIRQRPRSLADRGRMKQGIRYQEVGCNIRGRCYVGSDGRLHTFRHEGADEPVLIRHAGKADGTPFSSRAQPLGYYWGGTALIADPADGGVWGLDLEGEGPGFTRVALPGDDRFVEDLSQLLRLPRRSNALLSVNELVIRGERGVYMANRDAFQPVSPEVQSAVDELDRRRRRPEAAVTITGPVHFQVTVPASGAEPAYAHVYAPYPAADRALYLQMQALSLLRAPVLAAISPLVHRVRSLGNPTDNDARIVLDPLVMLGNGWVLGLNLLLAAVLATLTFRRQSRLGAVDGRRVIWTAVVAAFGVPAYVIYRACENKRAWHVLDVAQVRPPLLIQSAA